MDNSTLKNILDFLEKKENKKHKDRDNLVWKLSFGYSLTKEELNVKGSLDLRVTNITSIPDGLKVGWNLNLQNCTSLTSLPKGLKVGRNLYLENCKSLTSLPEGLEVGGDLDLSGSGIETLPKGLKVGGKLLLITTPITSLPEGLKVDGVLCCYLAEELESLPKGVKIGNQLDIRRTKITLLPRGLEVGGILRIGNTELEKYTDDELREMVKPGFIKGEILR